MIARTRVHPIALPSEELSLKRQNAFVFRVRDGRIASVAEHYNALITQQKLVPLMKEANTKVSGHRT